MAHLRTQATTQDLAGRLQWKLSLIKRMYELGYSRDKIQQIFRLLDRLMTLPPELDLNFQAELERFEAEQQMTYITSIERIGIAKATQKNISQILTIRFKDVPTELVEKLNKLYDIELLNQLLERAVTTGSISEFRQQLSQEDTNTDHETSR